MIGRTYLEAGSPVRILIRWGRIGAGPSAPIGKLDGSAWGRRRAPHNVLIERQMAAGSSGRSAACASSRRCAMANARSGRQAQNFLLRTPHLDDRRGARRQQVELRAVQGEDVLLLGHRDRCAAETSIGDDARRCATDALGGCGDLRHGETLDVAICPLQAHDNALSVADQDEVLLVLVVQPPALCLQAAQHQPLEARRRVAGAVHITPRGEFCLRDGREFSAQRALEAANPEDGSKRLGHVLFVQPSHFSIPAVLELAPALRMPLHPAALNEQPLDMWSQARATPRRRAGVEVQVGDQQQDCCHPKGEARREHGGETLQIRQICHLSAADLNRNLPSRFGCALLPQDFGDGESILQPLAPADALDIAGAA